MYRHVLWILFRLRFNTAYYNRLHCSALNFSGCLSRGSWGGNSLFTKRGVFIHHIPHYACCKLTKIQRVAHRINCKFVFLCCYHKCKKRFTTTDGKIHNLGVLKVCCCKVSPVIFSHIFSHIFHKLISAVILFFVHTTDTYNRGLQPRIFELCGLWHIAQDLWNLEKMDAQVLVSFTLVIIRWIFPYNNE